MTGYVYHGTQRDLGLDLEKVNAEILAAREPGSTGPRLESPVPMCSRGHVRTPENTYIRSNGTQRCRVCQTINRERRKRRKQKAGTP